MGRRVAVVGGGLAGITAALDCADAGANVSLLEGASPPDPLMRFECERAREWFERGLRLVPLLDRRSAACVLAMAGIYRRLLDRIESQPRRALAKRMTLPAWEKAWVALASLRAAAPAAHGGRAGHEPAVGGSR